MTANDTREPAPPTAPAPRASGRNRATHASAEADHPASLLEHFGADEPLQLERRSLAEALEAVDRGEIADAKSIVGLLWVARSLRLERR